MQQKPSRWKLDWPNGLINAVAELTPSHTTLMKTSGKKVINWWSLVRIFLGGLSLLGSTWALEATTLTVKVTVLAEPSCVINGGQPIEVDFGDEVVTTRVNGHNYMQIIPSNLVCSGLNSNSLRLMLDGDLASVGTNVLTTDQDGLGIVLLSNDQPLRLNESIPFTYPDMPVLTVAPVKLPGRTLKAGKFSAGATLKVEYL